MGNFRKAEKTKAKLRLGISGPAGSGKTYSALLIAQGLGGRIAMIDTENGSGDLYADLCSYDIATLIPPYTPQRYVELIKEAEGHYNVIIIDSLSHAWAGEGGVLDIHSDVTKSSRSQNSYTAWREVTPQHNALVEAMLGCKCHLIATMRAKTEYVLEDNGKGQSVPKKVGMAPIQREGMDYEFTVVLDMSVNHIATCEKDRTRLFPVGSPFMPEIETGKKLLGWLESGQSVGDRSLELKAGMREQIARQGSEKELIDWYHNHQGEIKQLLAEHKDEIIACLSERRQEFRATDKSTPDKSSAPAKSKEPTQNVKSEQKEPKSNADALAELDKARKQYFATASEMFADEDERHKWQVEMFPALPSTKEWNLQHYKEAISRLEIQKKKPETNLIASTEKLIKDFCTQENLEYHTALDFLSATTISNKESVLNSVNIHNKFAEMAGDTTAHKQMRKNVAKGVGEFHQWVADCNEVEPFDPSVLINALYRVSKINKEIVPRFFKAMSNGKDIKRLWHIEIDKLATWKDTLEKVCKELGIEDIDVANAAIDDAKDDMPF